MTNKESKGLIILCLGGKYFLCDGKDPENKNKLSLGTTIKSFETLDEAKALQKIIDSAYGYERE